jgi:hypothetical protein
MTNATYYNKDLQRWLGCGNASLHDWKNKGFIACEEERAASGKKTKIRFKYSAPEALHVGVVNQLSLLGVLLRPDSVLISLEQGESRMNPRPVLLTQPKVIIEHYSDLDFRGGLVIKGSVAPKPTAEEKRHKGVNYTCLIRIVPYGETANSGPSSAGRPHITLETEKRQRKDFPAAFDEWHRERSLFQSINITFISLPALASSMAIKGIKL